MGRDNYKGKVAARCKVQRLPAVRELCKRTAEPIEMPFGVLTRVGLLA